MEWLLLILAILFENAGTLSMKLSKGFTILLPSLLIPAFYIPSFALLTLALARPQFGSKLREVTRQGVEIMLAVDVSNSMLAQDFEPSRLERTKFAIDRLAEALKAFEIQGVKNNIPAVLTILQSDAFRSGDVHTGIIEQVMKKK